MSTIKIFNFAQAETAIQFMILQGSARPEVRSELYEEWKARIWQCVKSPNYPNDSKFIVILNSRDHNHNYVLLFQFAPFQSSFLLKWQESSFFAL